MPRTRKYMVGLTMGSRPLVASFPEARMLLRGRALSHKTSLCPGRSADGGQRCHPGHLRKEQHFTARISRSGCECQASGTRCRGFGPGDRRLRAAVRRTAVPDPGSGYSLSGQDGTGIPMRHSALVGRSGKKEDGSAKTREVKLVTVWSAESHRDSLAGLPHPRA